MSVYVSHVYVEALKVHVSSQVKEYIIQKTILLEDQSSPSSFDSSLSTW